MAANSYFFRLNAAQAAVVVGIYEVFTLIQLYLNLGMILGMIHDTKKGIISDFGTVDKIRDYAMGDDSEDSQAAAYAFGLTVFFAFLLLFPGLLLVGIIKGKRFLMLPWLVVGWIRAILGILVFIPVFALPVCSMISVYYFFAVVFWYAVTLYCLHAVNSHYCQVKTSLSQDAENVVVQYHNF